MSGARMMGRLGWHGQCKCCNGPRGKDQIRAEEKADTRREAIEAMFPPDVVADLDELRARESRARAARIVVTPYQGDTLQP